MDVFGKSLADHFKTGIAETLWLHNSYSDPEEMPVDIFFRTEDEMPELELTALSNCKGKILDVGAGAGSHAAVLQARGEDVTALDTSGEAVKIIRSRAINKVLEGDFFKLKGQRFDTLLFLMNGIGIAGTLDGFKDLLTFAGTLLNPGGQLLFDSSDIGYLYEEGIERPADRYFGEVSYQYEYQGQKGVWFDWLYIDQTILKEMSAALGWNCTILYDDGEDQYLAKLTRQDK